MKFKSLVYTMLKYSNDYNAVKKGKIGRRILRRATGRTAGKIFKKIFG